MILFLVKSRQSITLCDGLISNRVEHVVVAWTIQQIEDRFALLWNIMMIQRSVGLIWGPKIKEYSNRLCQSYEQQAC